MVTSNQNDTIQREDLAFKNVKVLTMEDEIWGLPAKIFVMGMTMVLSVSFILFWWAGPIVGMAYFIPMYEIHKDDPRAFDAWRRAMVRKHNYWQAGVATKTNLHIINKY